MEVHQALLARVQRLERLVEVGRDLSTLADDNALLQRLVEVGAELTHSEGCSILAYDAEAQQLRFIAAPWHQIHRLKGIPVPLEGSLAGWVFMQGHPLVTHEVAQDPRHFRQVDALLEQETRALIAVPVRFREQVLGVLEAFNRRDGIYTREDMDVLETLAGYAAIVLHNMSLRRQVKQAQDALGRLERMKADFIAIASHELRTPLGLILGFATHLRQILPPDQRHHVDPIIRGAVRLKEVIENLSHLENFRRQQAALVYQPVNLYTLVQQLVEELAPLAAERRVTVEVDRPEAAPLVEGDREKLLSALRQVLKNAIQFNRADGRVRISFHIIPGYVKVMVEDTGPGIPQEDLERIFERFYQVEGHLTRRHGGMGLGLAIAKTLIEAHEGRIWAESEPGKGSVFSILLPMRRQTLPRGTSTEGE